MYNPKRLGLNLLLALMLSACSADETQVRQAAQQRWEALIQGDLDRAYTTHSQAFQATTSLAAFKQQMRGKGLWQKAEVKAVHCLTAKQCKVEVEVTMAMHMWGVAELVETSDTLEETWLQQGWIADWRYIK